MKKLLVALGLSQALFANMYHLKLLSDKIPDLSNIQAFGYDIGAKWQSNNEKAIILNYWLSQLSTYAEPLYFSRQWDDPIAFLNSNEYGMCSDMTLLFNAMGEGAFGFTGRRHELSELDEPIAHTVPEIFYDGALHFFDPSFGFAYGHYDNGVVTSMEDYALNSYYSRHNTPTALTRDSDGAGVIKAWLSADLFGWSIDRFRYDQYQPDRTWEERTTEGYYGVHRFDISIDDDEFYTRYWHHLDGLEGFHSHDFFWPHYNYRDTGDFSWHDDDYEKGEHRGNGLWVYTPNLTESSSYESAEGMTLVDDGLSPSLLDVESEVVFKVDSANFVTGVLVEAEIRRDAPEDSLIIEASSSGGNYWFPVWENKDTGDIYLRENISDMIRGTLQSQDLRQVDDFLVRVRMNTVSSVHASVLKSIKISTVTMLGKGSLPKLKLGTNEITLSEANNHALYQTKKFNPVLTKLESGQNDEIFWDNREVWKLYAQDFKNIEASANYGNLYTGLWKNSGELGWVTYRLEAPRAIKKARLGGSFVVRENSQDMFKIKYRVFNGSWSEWREVATYDWNSRNVSDKRENQSHLEEWDITEPDVTKVEFKTELYSYPHIAALHMEVDYEAKVTEDKPLYISYSWTEYEEDEHGHLPDSADGGVTRTYKEKITNLPHTFSINTGGVIQPRMNWVSMALEDNEDPNHQVPLGYSDGVDKGDGDRIPMINYDIGNIISIGKSITLSTAPQSGEKEQLVDGRIVAGSNGERGNAGGGKVEVQNDADDIVKFAPGFGTLDIVIDLGSVQSVGGVRVDAFKDAYEDYFPESISVEIATAANQYTHVATDRYKSAKYAQNLYPIQWSLPKNANSFHLGRFPNYGLFSNYIFVPFEEVHQARYIKIRVKEQNYNGDAKGVTLVETHVYDKLVANQWSPKLQHAKDMVIINPPQEPSVETIDLEAESAVLASDMRIKNDANAFDGKYISSYTTSGDATYTFNIAQDGVFTIYSRTIAPSGDNDSFYVQMDNEDEDIWDVKNRTTWNWSQVNSRSLGTIKSYNLSAGTHTLRIRAREKNTLLDRLVITNDTNYQLPSNPPVVASHVTVEIEAESGAISSPMQEQNDADAFGGKYIVTNSGEGKATYTIDIDMDGTYKLWARTIAIDGNSDSFFITMDEGSESIWDIDDSDSWSWSRVHSRALGDVQSFTLSAGTHTLVVRGREAHVKLDKLILTNDDAYEPQEPQPNGAVLEIEGEDAVVNNPMYIGDDTLASGGKYITNNYGSGSAEFRFNVTEEGDYKLEGVYIAPDGSSDSFYVSMDNVSEDIWDLHPNTESWNTITVSGRNNGGEIVYNLSLGLHTFKLRGREGGAKLDKLTLIKQ